MSISAGWSSINAKSLKMFRSKETNYSRVFTKFAHLSRTAGIVLLYVRFVSRVYIYMYIFIGKFRNFPEFLKLIPNRSTWNIVFGVLFGGGGGKRKGITFVGRGERNVRETCNFAPITPTMLYINIEWKGVTCTACTYPSIVSLCAEIDGGRLFANLHPRANRYVRLCAPLFARDNARIKNSLFGNGASTPRRIRYPMDIK